MVIIPDQHLASELIKSAPDAAHGFVALIGDYLHAHGDSLQHKAEIIEAAALKKIGAETGKEIYQQAVSLFKRIAGREMLVCDLERMPVDLGKSFVSASRYVQNEELQGLWASLLASYVNTCAKGEYPRSAFVSVLKDLTPLDARCLEKIYLVETSLSRSTASLAHFLDQAIVEDSQPVGDLVYAGKSVATALLPEEAFLSGSDKSPSIAKLAKPLNSEIVASIGNITRLGLVEPERYIDGGSDPRRVFHTAFGYEFCKSVFPISLT
jgi:hypothetical protein